MHTMVQLHPIPGPTCSQTAQAVPGPADPGPGHGKIKERIKHVLLCIIAILSAVCIHDIYISVECKFYLRFNMVYNTNTWNLTGIIWQIMF